MPTRSGTRPRAHTLPTRCARHRLPALSLLGLSLLAAATGCGGPVLLFPGGKLAGDVVRTPVEDWSFATDSTVVLETRPEAPYSVRINYVVRDGALYIDAAEGRRWLAHLRADPRCRVRFGDRIHPVTAVLVGRPGELVGFDPERYVYRLDSRRVSRTGSR